jgi:peptide/nickel transport system permease protein
MLRYFLHRLLQTLPIIFGVSVVCFILVHIAPGDPIDSLLPEGATPELVQEVKTAYGLDKPLPAQYLYWLGNVLQGDLGHSISTQRPVMEEIAPAVKHSMQIALLAIVLSFSIGALIGAIGGRRINSGLDRVLTSVSVAGISVPPYWLGMLLVVFFAVSLQWLPASGAADGAPWDQQLKHMLLPALALSIVPMGVIARSTRAAVAEVSKHDFVSTLIAKGLPTRKVNAHIAKNVAPSLIAVMGLQFAQLLGGSILVETVFSWPGAGFLLNNAIFTRDLPVLQGTILVLAMFFVVTNLLVDMLQMALDPRIRRQ